MTYTTSQMKRLAGECGAGQHPDYPYSEYSMNIEGRTITFARCKFNTAGHNWRMSLEGERVVIEKLQLLPSYDPKSAKWAVMFYTKNDEYGFSATDEFDTLSEVINAAISDYLCTSEKHV